MVTQRSEKKVDGEYKKCIIDEDDKSGKSRITNSGKMMKKEVKTTNTNTTIDSIVRFTDLLLFNDLDTDFLEVLPFLSY